MLRLHRLAGPHHDGVVRAEDDVVLGDLAVLRVDLGAQARARLLDPLTIRSRSSSRSRSRWVFSSSRSASLFISGPVASSRRLVRSRSRASMRRSVSSWICLIRRSRAWSLTSVMMYFAKYSTCSSGRGVTSSSRPIRGGRALHEPDVADRRGQLDVAHALAPHLGPRDLDAALVADDALVAHALVLAAGALPVLRRTEDALAEQAVTLRLERAVVDRLRLRHLAARPGANLLRRGERDAHRVEIVNLEHPTPSRAGGE